MLPLKSAPPTSEAIQALKSGIEKKLAQFAEIKEQRKERARLLEQRMTEENYPEATKTRFRQELAKRETEYLRVMRKKIGIESFEKIKMLGKGAFGAVWLVREKKNGRICAIKQLDKKEMVSRGQIEHCKTERDLMSSSLSEWIILLHYSFQDKNYLYLVMDFAIGGDLMGMLIRVDVFPEYVAKFYIAEACTCIHEIHKNHSLYRDAKPDNFLISASGHLRLSDFGLSKRANKTDPSSDAALKDVHGACDVEAATAEQADESLSKTDHSRLRAHSTVGTPDYSAVEILRKDPQGYDHKVDWWSIGAILFECVFGYPPFASDSSRETCKKIVNYRQALRFPREPKVSRECIDLLLHLLCEPEVRYDFDQIKAHPWFTGIDWSNLQAYKPPFKPVVDSDTDTRYFDFIDDGAEQKKQAAHGPNSKKTMAWFTQDDNFKGYTYRAFPGTVKGEKTDTSHRTSLRQIFGNSGGLAGLKDT